MKKLFLGIAIASLVIILIATVLALLSVFNLSPFFPQLSNTTQEILPQDQATVLIAYVDDIGGKRFHVESAWVLYLVASRMDTAMIEDAIQAQSSSKILTRSVTQTSFVRYVEREEDIHIDYVFLVDRDGRELVNDLLENQQSSINLSDSGEFCEILNENQSQLFDLYLTYAGNHVSTTIPQSLIKQLAVNENPKDSIYCESIQN